MVRVKRARKASEKDQALTACTVEVARDLWIQALRCGAGVRFKAAGRSMEPAITQGAILLVSPHVRPSIGDIVLVCGGRGIFAHRLIGVQKDTIITRGDALEAPDPPLPPSALLGTVVSVRPGPMKYRVSGLLRRILKPCWKIARPLFTTASGA
jgi:hypothetical protein